MDNIRLILASKSPRRSDILKQAEFRFEIFPSDVPEDDLQNLSPVDHVLTLSKRKAEAVRSSFSDGVIIGADTIVSRDGSTLEKPKNENEAFDMLSSLSGRTHEVFTGLTLIRIGSGQISDVACTKVTFRHLEEWEILDYIETGGPMDKAGGYGIQEQAGAFVESIEGCYFNVVGFPLALFLQRLKSMLGSEGIRSIRNIQG